MSRFLYKLLHFSLAILMLPLFSLTALTQDGSAELCSLHFNIELLEDGSAYITDTREIVFTDDREFTRPGVNNSFVGPRESVNWQVPIDGTPLSQLDEPDNEGRPENTFVVEGGDGENIVYIYFRQEGSGTRVFQISYQVGNAVKLHSDAGEFFWNLTEESELSDIGALTVILTVPQGVPEEEFRIWVHGPLRGTFEKQPNSTAFLQVDSVPMRSIVDICSILSADCSYGGWERQGEVLDEILAEEKEFVDSANTKRKEKERIKAEQEAYHAERVEWEGNHPILYLIERLIDEICYFRDKIYDFFLNFMDEIGWNIFYVLVFGSFFDFLIIILSLHGKIEGILRRSKQKKSRNSPTRFPQYYRDLSDDRFAPAADRLVYFYDGKSSISKQISAASSELNLKKLIHLQTTARDAEFLLNTQTDETTFPPDAPLDTAEPEHVPDYQKILWDFLRNAADGSGWTSTENLKKHIKDNRDVALSPHYSFEGSVGRGFTERVKSKDVAGHSRGRLKHRLIVSAVAGIFVILIRTVGTPSYGTEFGEFPEPGLGILVVVVVIEPTIYFWGFAFKTLCYALGQQSENDLALWQAFGWFLDGFTTFKGKEPPEFPVWWGCMVHAAATGKGQTMVRALALKYPEAGAAGMSAFDDDWYRWTQETTLYDATDSTDWEVAEAKEPRSSGGGSDSDWSDGGGGGGGFSNPGGGSDSGSGGSSTD